MRPFLYLSRGNFNTSRHGPLVDKIQYDRVWNYIQDGLAAGAKCNQGAVKLGSEGYFISPTIFEDVSDDMRIAREEIFGPVVVALKFKTIDEVIERANDTMYGLAAAIHTNNHKNVVRMTNEVGAGTVWVNCYNMFFHQMPFGGFKVLLCWLI